MTIRQHVVSVSSGPAIEIIPSFALANGSLVRPSPFSTGDAVFATDAVAAAKAFIAGTRARVFHLIDVEGAGAPALATAQRIVEAGAEAVILEGRITDRSLAAPNIRLVVDEASDLTSEQDGELVAVRGDDDIFERVVRAIERGLDIVHYAADPAIACKLSTQLQHWGYVVREPTAVPADVEEVVGFHKRLHRGGVRSVIVDGEWYVDYNTLNEPFDLLR